MDVFGRIGALSLGAVVVAAISCGSPPTTTRALPTTTPTTVALHDGPSVKLTAQDQSAATSASDAFRQSIVKAASQYDADVTRLGADLGTQSNPPAPGAVDHSAQVAAQGDFDWLRELIGTTSPMGIQIDATPVELAPNAKLSGLHGVECGLWNNGSPTQPTPAAKASAGQLVDSAPEVEFLLSKVFIDPQAIAALAVSELGWLNNVAVVGAEETCSHLDTVDVVATVNAAKQAFDEVQPLAQLVEPKQSVLVASSFDSLETQIQPLVPPNGVPDDQISAGNWLKIAQDVDATASAVAGLEAPFEGLGAASVPGFGY